MPIGKKPYRPRPEKFIGEEARTLIEGGDITALPWYDEGLECVKPVFWDLVGSLGAPGSDNWRPDAWAARIWLAKTVAEKRECRQKLFDYFEAAEKKWMGDERGAIYFPHHLTLALSAAKWARKERDFELLALVQRYLLYAAAFRAAVTYDGVCYWIGQRSAGINYTGTAKPGSRSFGSDYDDFALGRKRGEPEGRRGKNWTAWDHILHECWQEVYEAAKPLRDGERPLAVMDRLAFRLMSPVHILETEHGFATWELRMVSGDTQAVLAVVKIDGRPARYVPADCANDAKNRRKGHSKLRLVGNTLLYTSPVYGEQEEPLPPGDPYLYVIVGGRDGGVEDLLADSEDEPPVDPPEPEEPPIPDDPPGDHEEEPEPDSGGSWWQRVVEAWKEWWSGR